MQYRDLINPLLKKYAYRKESINFTLASGKRSDEYVDVKNAILHPASWPLVYAMATVIPEDTDAIAGIVSGGIPLAVLAARMRGKPALMVRTTPKGHGTGELIEGIANVRNKKTNCWLIEDVVSTGTTTLAAVGVLKDYHQVGLLLTGILVVCDRTGDNMHRLREACPGINIEALTTLESVREARP